MIIKNTQGQEKLLNLKEKLLIAEEQRKKEETYSLDQVANRIQEIIGHRS